MASGPISSIVLDGRRFTSNAEDDCSITYPGFTNEVKQNGDGTNRSIKSRHAGKIEGLNIIIDPDRDDQEFLKSMQDKLNLVSVSLTMVDGNVLSGNMQLTEAVAVSLKENTASITLEGHLEKL